MFTIKIRTIGVLNELRSLRVKMLCELKLRSSSIPNYLILATIFAMKE